MSDFVRHVLVARLGPGDNTSVRTQPADAVHAVQFIDGDRRFGRGLGSALAQVARLGLQPSETAIDLMLLAACVTAADTRISRYNEGQDGWRREIALHLPVSDPDLWSGQAYLLKRMLDFLSGDRWTLSFHPRPSRMGRLAPSMALCSVDCDTVCLFSGGLDSFIGVIDLLEEGAKPVLTSQYDPTNSAYQTATVEHLKRRFGASLPPRVGVNLTFPTDLLQAGSDNNLRARSFLFFAHAALVASAIPGGAEVKVPENGFISLNVPLDPLRLGSFSTRTTHPFYLARWNELLGGIGLPVQLTNPYQYATKGEMVRSCADPAFLGTAAVDTMSCSSPTKMRWQGQAPMHCGYCMPCLIRRGSLLAGMGSDPTSYFLSTLNARPLDSLKAEGEHIRSFQLAAERLRTRPASAARLIHLPGPLFDDGGSLDKYERVYRAGMAEVTALLSGVVTRPL